MLRKKEEVKIERIDACHDGKGIVECLPMLSSNDSQRGIMFLHDDIIPPNTSIGEHLHANDEEVYYLIEGECTLIYDGKEMPMKTGDVSVVQSGHSHGLINEGNKNARLIVFGVK